MTQQHGRRYEHELAQQLDTVAETDTWVTTAGYSGNSVIDGCDIVVTYMQPDAMLTQINIEAKKRQGTAGKRTLVASLDEIERLQQGTPYWGNSCVALKFDHRQVIVCDPNEILSAIRSECDSPQRPIVNTLSPRLTGSNKISVVKPTTDEWTSARAGNDGQYLYTVIQEWSQ